MALTCGASGIILRSSISLAWNNFTQRTTSDGGSLENRLGLRFFRSQISSRNAME
jgi:hypothetical protein